MCHQLIRRSIAWVAHEFLPYHTNWACNWYLIHIAADNAYCHSELQNIKRARIYLYAACPWYITLFCIKLYWLNTDHELLNCFMDLVLALAAHAHSQQCLRTRLGWACTPPQVIVTQAANRDSKICRRPHNHWLPQCLAVESAWG